MIKLVILGDTTVGKTSIIQQYVRNRFSQNYRSTIGASLYHKDVVIDGTSTTIQVNETICY